MELFYSVNSKALICIICLAVCSRAEAVTAPPTSVSNTVSSTDSPSPTPLPPPPHTTSALFTSSQHAIATKVSTNFAENSITTSSQNLDNEQDVSNTQSHEDMTSSNGGIFPTVERTTTSDNIYVENLTNDPLVIASVPMPASAVTSQMAVAHQINVTDSHLPSSSTDDVKSPMVTESLSLSTETYSTDATAPAPTEIPLIGTVTTQHLHHSTTPLPPPLLSPPPPTLSTPTSSFHPPPPIPPPPPVELLSNMTASQNVTDLNGTSSIPPRQENISSTFIPTLNPGVSTNAMPTLSSGEIPTTVPVSMWINQTGTNQTIGPVVPATVRPTAVAVNVTQETLVDSVTVSTQGISVPVTTGPGLAFTENGTTSTNIKDAITTMSPALINGTNNSFAFTEPALELPSNTSYNISLSNTSAPMPVNMVTTVLPTEQTSTTVPLPSTIITPTSEPTSVEEATSVTPAGDWNYPESVHVSVTDSVNEAVNEDSVPPTIKAPLNVSEDENLAVYENSNNNTMLLRNKTDLNANTSLTYNGTNSTMIMRTLIPHEYEIFTNKSNGLETAFTRLEELVQAMSASGDAETQDNFSGDFNKTWSEANIFPTIFPVYNDSSTTTDTELDLDFMNLSATVQKIPSLAFVNVSVDDGRSIDSSNGSLVRLKSQTDANAVVNEGSSEGSGFDIVHTVEISGNGSNVNTSGTSVDVTNTTLTNEENATGVYEAVVSLGVTSATPDDRGVDSVADHSTVSLSLSLDESKLNSTRLPSTELQPSTHFEPFITTEPERLNIETTTAPMATVSSISSTIPSRLPISTVNEHDTVASTTTATVHDITVAYEATSFLIDTTTQKPTGDHFAETNTIANEINVSVVENTTMNGDSLAEIEKTTNEHIIDPMLTSSTTDGANSSVESNFATKAVSSYDGSGDNLQFSTESEFSGTAHSTQHSMEASQTTDSYIDPNTEVFSNDNTQTNTIKVTRTSEFSTDVHDSSSITEKIIVDTPPDAVTEIVTTEASGDFDSEASSFVYTGVTTLASSVGVTQPLSFDYSGDDTDMPVGSGVADTMTTPSTSPETGTIAKKPGDRDTVVLTTSPTTTFLTSTAEEGGTLENTTLKEASHTTSLSGILNSTVFHATEASTDTVNYPDDNRTVPTTQKLNESTTLDTFVTSTLAAITSKIDTFAPIKSTTEGYADEVSTVTTPIIHEITIPEGSADMENTKVTTAGVFPEDSTQLAVSVPNGKIQNTTMQDVSQDSTNGTAITGEENEGNSTTRAITGFSYDQSRSASKGLATTMTNPDNATVTASTLLKIRFISDSNVTDKTIAQALVDAISQSKRRKRAVSASNGDYTVTVLGSRIINTTSNEIEANFTVSFNNDTVSVSDATVLFNSSKIVDGFEQQNVTVRSITLPPKDASGDIPSSVAVETTSLLSITMESTNLASMTSTTFTPTDTSTLGPDQTSGMVSGTMEATMTTGTTMGADNTSNLSTDAVDLTTSTVTDNTILSFSFIPRSTVTEIMIAEVLAVVIQNETIPTRRRKRAASAVRGNFNVTVLSTRVINMTTNETEANFTVSTISGNVLVAVVASTLFESKTEELINGFNGTVSNITSLPMVAEIETSVTGLTTLESSNSMESTTIANTISPTFTATSTMETTTATTVTISAFGTTEDQTSITDETTMQSSSNTESNSPATATAATAVTPTSTLVADETSGVVLGTMETTTSAITTAGSMETIGTSTEVTDDASGMGSGTMDTTTFTTKTGTSPLITDETSTMAIGTVETATVATGTIATFNATEPPTDVGSLTTSIATDNNRVTFRFIPTTSVNETQIAEALLYAIQNETVPVRRRKRAASASNSNFNVTVLNAVVIDTTTNETEANFTVSTSDGDVLPDSVVLTLFENKTEEFITGFSGTVSNITLLPRATATLVSDGTSGVATSTMETTTVATATLAIFNATGTSAVVTFESSGMATGTMDTTTSTITTITTGTSAAVTDESSGMVTGTMDTTTTGTGASAAVTDESSGMATGTMDTTTSTITTITTGTSAAVTDESSGMATGTMDATTNTTTTTTAEPSTSVGGLTTSAAADNTIATFKFIPTTTVNETQIARALLYAIQNETVSARRRKRAASAADSTFNVTVFDAKVINTTTNETEANFTVSTISGNVLSASVVAMLFEDKTEELITGFSGRVSNITLLPQATEARSSVTDGTTMVLSSSTEPTTLASTTSTTVASTLTSTSVSDGTSGMAIGTMETTTVATATIATSNVTGSGTSSLVTAVTSGMATSTMGTTTITTATDATFNTTGTSTSVTNGTSGIAASTMETITVATNTIGTSTSVADITSTMAAVTMQTTTATTPTVATEPSTTSTAGIDNILTFRFTPAANSTNINETEIATALLSVIRNDTVSARRRKRAASAVGGGYNVTVLDTRVIDMTTNEIEANFTVSDTSGSVLPASTVTPLYADKTAQLIAGFSGRTVTDITLLPTAAGRTTASSTSTESSTSADTTATTTVTTPTTTSTTTSTEPTPPPPTTDTSTTTTGSTTTASSTSMSTMSTATSPTTGSGSTTSMSTMSTAISATTGAGTTTTGSTATTSSTSMSTMPTATSPTTGTGTTTITSSTSMSTMPTATSPTTGTGTTTITSSTSMSTMPTATSPTTGTGTTTTTGSPTTAISSSMSTMSTATSPTTGNSTTNATIGSTTTTEPPILPWYIIVIIILGAICLILIVVLATYCYKKRCGKAKTKKQRQHIFAPPLPRETPRPRKQTPRVNDTVSTHTETGNGEDMVDGPMNVFGGAIDARPRKDAKSSPSLQPPSSHESVSDKTIVPVSPPIHRYARHQVPPSSKISHEQFQPVFRRTIHPVSLAPIYPVIPRDVGDSLTDDAMMARRHDIERHKNKARLRKRSNRLGPYDGAQTDIDRILDPPTPALLRGSRFPHNKRSVNLGHAEDPEISAIMGRRKDAPGRYIRNTESPSSLDSAENSPKTARKKVKDLLDDAFALISPSAQRNLVGPMPPSTVQPFPGYPPPDGHQPFERIPTIPQYSHPNDHAYRPGGNIPNIPQYPHLNGHIQPPVTRPPDFLQPPHPNGRMHHPDGRTTGFSPYSPPKDHMQPPIRKTQDVPQLPHPTERMIHPDGRTSNVFPGDRPSFGSGLPSSDEPLFTRTRSVFQVPYDSSGWTPNQTQGFRPPPTNPNYHGVNLIPPNSIHGAPDLNQSYIPPPNGFTNDVNSAPTHGTNPGTSSASLLQSVRDELSRMIGKSTPVQEFESPKKDD